MQSSQFLNQHGDSCTHKPHTRIVMTMSKNNSERISRQTSTRIKPSLAANPTIDLTIPANGVNPKANAGARIPEAFEILSLMRRKVFLPGCAKQGSSPYSMVRMPKQQPVACGKQLATGMEKAYLQPVQSKLVPFRQLAVLALTSLRPCSFASSPFDDFALIDWHYNLTTIIPRMN